MCEQCNKQRATTNFEPSKIRLKLWEIDSRYHCAILGTCLSMDELRKVMRQSNVILPGKPTDYEMHSTMVMAAGEKGQESRIMHKFLDRKYKRQIQLLTQCKDANELEHNWELSMESGDIAGTLWAIMSHPRTGIYLRQTMFGDVHMLSHLQGASNRVDIQRLKSLETEVAELKETLNKSRQGHQHQLERRDIIIQQQEQELHNLTATRPRNSDETDKITTDQIKDVYKINQTMERHIKWAKTQLAERDMRITEFLEKINGLKEMLTELQEEHKAMEQAMVSLLAEDTNSSVKSDTEINLGGKNILYVGGRSTLTPHLRALVEAHNGLFKHHDGGLEDSRAGLKCQLAGADMVFCPVDCISHDACLRVKRYCQQQAKPFIPLRSSGLSAFTASLQQLSSAKNEAHLNG